MWLRLAVLLFPIFLPLCIGAPRPPVYVGSGDPYQPGRLLVRNGSVRAGQAGAPVPLLIFAPDAPSDGGYAVVVFQHGFVLANSYYSTILSHLASHGFVVVAPQMYPPLNPFAAPPTPEEAATAVQVMEWLPTHLSVLAGVTARTDVLGIAGHSRGGKVAWMVLKQDNHRAQAVAGIDPVDSSGVPPGSEEPVTTSPANFPFPSLVLGAALSSQSAGMLDQPCAPEAYNHEQFYRVSAAPAYHTVALNNGHMDMLDAQPPGCGPICTVCVEGPDQDGMRQLTAGLMTAVFRGSLQDDQNAYQILTDVASAPVPVTMESK